jgi:hypothetical protein
MLTQEVLTTSTLNDELREFAEEMPVVVSRLTSDEVIAAIEPHFPELVRQAANLTELMDAVGLSAVVRLGADLFISWSTADNAEDAAAQRLRFSQPSYSQIRKSLGIQHHWIIKVRPDFWEYDDDKLIDGYGDFRDDGSPECWILDLD